MNKSKSIKSFNDKYQRHGLWECYWFDGTLMYRCFYHNGKEIGYDEDYTLNDKLHNKTYHHKTYHL